MVNKILEYVDLGRLQGGVHCREVVKLFEVQGACNEVLLR